MQWLIYIMKMGYHTRIPRFTYESLLMLLLCTQCTLQWKKNRPQIQIFCDVWINFRKMFDSTLGRADSTRYCVWFIELHGISGWIKYFSKVDSNIGKYLDLGSVFLSVYAVKFAISTTASSELSKLKKSIALELNWLLICKMLKLGKLQWQF